MADTVYTYNPKKVTMSLGMHIVSGFADDSFITIEPQGDGVTSVTGADGEIVRSIDPSTQSIVKLVLSAYSKTNKFLEEQFYKDQDTGTGTFPVNVNDLMGKKKFFADVAWVTKLPSTAYGKAAGTSEWEIQTGASKRS